MWPRRHSPGRATGQAQRGPAVRGRGPVGDQEITDRWQAEITQSGQNVSAKPVSWNGVISPGSSVNFGFNGTSSGQVSDPKAFTLNGGTCETAE